MMSPDKTEARIVLGFFISDSNNRDFERSSYSACCAKNPESERAGTKSSAGLEPGRWLRSGEFTSPFGCAMAILAMPEHGQDARGTIPC